jgi:hypothetical protein
MGRCSFKSIEQGVGGRVWGVGFGWMGILTPTNLYTPPIRWGLKPECSWGGVWAFFKVFPTPHHCNPTPRSEATINKLASANEGPGTAQKVAQFGIFNVEANNTSRVIMRHSLELEDSFAIDGKPIWENVKEISSEPLPSAFLPLNS